MTALKTKPRTSKANGSKTQGFRRDIKINGKSVTVRVHPQVWERFEEIAKAEGMSLSAATKQALAAAGGKDYSEAIELLVRVNSGNQPLTKHKTREAWLSALIELMRPVFASRGYPLPAKIVATMGFPSKGWRGDRIGECWPSGASAAGIVEIFIHPCQIGVMRIANILTHELCHAAHEQWHDDNAKPAKDGTPRPYRPNHGKRFAAIGDAMDLEGKPKYMLGGAAWEAWASVLVDGLGPMPFDPLAAYVKKEKKQTTRMLKFVHESCDGAEGEDYIWRASAKHTVSKETVACPCCGEWLDNPHYGEGDEAEDGGE